MPISVHDYERRLQLVLRLIKTDQKLLKENRAVVLGFHRQIVAEGISLPRQVKYLHTLRKLGRMLERPFVDVQKDDIVGLLARLEELPLKDSTKRDCKVILKRFCKWLRNSDDYPPEVKWIHAGVKASSQLLPDQLLTEEEVLSLAENAFSVRDRALTLALYESGCRAGEILSLRVGQVQFDEYGCVLHVTGKTGSRRVRLISSAPDLGAWLNAHPSKKPNAPLWTLNTGTEPMTYVACRKVIATLAARAGLRKKVHPHLFRHSRASFLANHLTESQLSSVMGWVPGTKMAATYVHLSGRDVDKALLRLNGVTVEENGVESKLRSRSCPRCREKNGPSETFCLKCGAPLDLNAAIRVDEERQNLALRVEELESQRIDRSEMDELKKIVGVLMERVTSRQVSSSEAKAILDGLKPLS